MTSSLINSISGLHVKPSLRSSQALPLNPISKLRISKPCKDDFGFLSNGVLRFNGAMAKRNVFVVYANTTPGVPLPSGPPSSSPMSWVLGLIVSLIIPLFTGKFGSLGVIKKIENAVQTVEDIAEAVEKVAGEVDKIAENIAHDLPEGKLKNLVEMVEDVAEKTAKQADCLDNIIDKVQEAEDQVEDIIIAASVAERVKQSPTKDE